MTDKAIRGVADRLNNRPRKVLNFRTPNEVFNTVLLHLLRESQRNNVLSVQRWTIIETHGILARRLVYNGKRMRTECLLDPSLRII